MRMTSLDFFLNQQERETKDLLKVRSLFFNQAPERFQGEKGLANLWVVVLITWLYSLGIGVAQAKDSRGKGVAKKKAVSVAQPVNKGRMITLSDFGAEDLGYLALPEQPPRGGIVLVPSQWGLNNWMKGVADALAREGYLAVAVDILNGATPQTKEDAERRRKDIHLKLATETALAGVRLLKESPKLKVPHVALVGYGVGAHAAWEASFQGSQGQIDALVVVEGPLLEDSKALRRSRVPTLAFFAETKDSLFQKKVFALEQILKQGNPSSRVYLLPGGQGCTEPHSPRFRSESAQRVRSFLLSFLAPIFNRPPPTPGWLDRVKGNFKSWLD